MRVKDQKVAKLRLNLHGTILEWKSIGLDPKSQKKSSKGELMIWRTKLRSKAWSNNSRIPLASNESKFVPRNLDHRHASKVGISVFWSGKIEQIGETTLHSQIHWFHSLSKFTQLWWEVDGVWILVHFVSILPTFLSGLLWRGRSECNCEWVGLRKSTHAHNHTLSPTWSYHGATSYIDSVQIVTEIDQNST